MEERGVRVQVMIPLNLDGFLFSKEWTSGKKSRLTSRLAADFVGWQSDKEKFEKGVARVLLALRADTNTRGACS